MNLSTKDVVISAACRTPLASFQGALKNLSAPQLGAECIKSALAGLQISTAEINEVLMGCVLSAGVGQAPARQSALLAGLPNHVGCTTINKVCGSAMKAIMIGYDMIKAGSGNIIVAGGMESMSNAPYLLVKARDGYRIGHQEVFDHMFYDGLEDARNHLLMGEYAEQCVEKFNFSRQIQDEFAIESVNRARLASNSGAFKNEIVPIQIVDKKQSHRVEQDEQVFKSDINKIAKLKPAFRRNTGTVTAANASSISDGAAVVVLTNQEYAKQNNIPCLAKILAHSNHAQAPEEFTTAPAGAIKKVLEKINWSLEDVDLFEINEAFAAVTLAAIDMLGINPQKVNVNGGACAMGHPIGASGARIVVTLLHALRARNLKKGIASLCIGGGEATAVAIEITE